MKKLLMLLVCACLLLAGACAEEGVTTIQLGDDAILVNNAPISEDASAPVHLVHQVEVHEDVPEELEGLSNRVVTLAGPGTYRFTGAAEDVQIAVRAGADDAVRIILDGVSISCRTAPAIAVHTAKDIRTANEYAVTIQLADGSANSISGSHTEEVEEGDVKLSGAITSLVSLGFDGEGYLNVVGDNEGIEVKFGHMTFDGGNIVVTSGDDPLNASEDNLSVITVNDGTLHLQVNPEKNGEGDGMDSNGSIIINGGAVASYAHPDSRDSGIDSDLGCTINGGVVLGAGNMYDEISAGSNQLFMDLQFVEKVDDMIVVTTEEGVPVAVSEPSEGYTSFVFSSPDLVEGEYCLYLGGELEVQDGEMIYTPGTQLKHGGSVGGKMGRGSMGKPGLKFFEGMKGPEDMPEGMEQSGRMPPPEMAGFDGPKEGRMRSFGADEDIGVVSTTFYLAPHSTMFAGITTVE